MFRPKYHFTVKEGYMNDPNGLIYNQKTKQYHLFYQYSKKINTDEYFGSWIEKNWGHATSTDLIHFKEEKVVLKHDNIGLIWSGSSLIDSGKVRNVIASTSSHNMSSEKQFRNPTEYGAPKPKTATFTATGGASMLLTNENTGIKVESSTIGRILDYNQTDPLNMGSVMAPAAADTIYRHLKDMNRDPSYYDLILTGDLGLYGKEILIDFMKTEYGLDISSNYNDCGVMLYDLETQKEVLAGGSGPVCSALVNYSLVIEMLKKKKIKKVLLVATGALFSPTMVYQHENILSIAHAVSLEVIK